MGRHNSETAILKKEERQSKNEKNLVADDVGKSAGLGTIPILPKSQSSHADFPSNIGFDAEALHPLTQSSPLSIHGVDVIPSKFSTKQFSKEEVDMIRQFLSTQARSLFNFITSQKKMSQLYPGLYQPPSFMGSTRIPMELIQPKSHPIISSGSPKAITFGYEKSSSVAADVQFKDVSVPKIDLFSSMNQSGPGNSNYDNVSKRKTRFDDYIPLEATGTELIASYEDDSMPVVPEPSQKRPSQSEYETNKTILIREDQVAPVKNEEPMASTAKSLSPTATKSSIAKTLKKQEKKRERQGDNVGMTNISKKSESFESVKKGSSTSINVDSDVSHSTHSGRIQQPVHWQNSRKILKQNSTRENRLRREQENQFRKNSRIFHRQFHDRRAENSDCNSLDFEAPDFEKRPFEIRTADLSKFQIPKKSSKVEWKKEVMKKTKPHEGTKKDKSLKRAFKETQVSACPPKQRKLHNSSQLADNEHSNSLMIHEVTKKDPASSVPKRTMIISRSIALNSSGPVFFSPLPSEFVSTSEKKKPEKKNISHDKHAVSTSKAIPAIFFSKKLDY